MVTKVEAWSASDGRVFPTQRAARDYELTKSLEAIFGERAGIVIAAIAEHKSKLHDALNDYYFSMDREEETNAEPSKTPQR